MEIQDAIKEMEKYIEGILTFPNPYHDPDIDALETLIEFAKKIYKCIPIVIIKFIFNYKYMITIGIHLWKEWV